MKEFKVGDKCVVEYTVTEMTEEHYPIKCKTKNEIEESFTNDGLYIIGDAIPALKHIEDIIPKPEFPKWMMVKIDNKWVKRKVIYKDEFGYAFITTGNETLDCSTACSCKLAKEIEPENNKLQELEKKHKELGQEIEKLKNKQ